MKFRLLLSLSTILMISVLTENIKAQCSDAGVCMLDSNHGTIDNSTEGKNNFRLGYSYSSSGKEDNISYNMVRLGAKIFLNDIYSVSFVIPYLSQSAGNFGASSSGFGDAIFSLSGKPELFWGNKVTFHAGAKLPLSLIDKEKFGYLNGYGTFDFLVGVGYNVPSFSITVAAQIPITKYSDDSAEYERGADVMLKTGYNMNFEKLNLLFEGLFIKRLNKSEFLNKLLINPVPIKIPESDFLQIDFQTTASYRFENNIVADISLAVPMLNRKENSDGTKRSITIQFGVGFNF